MNPPAPFAPRPTFWDKLIIPILVGALFGVVGLGWKLYDTLSALGANQSAQAAEIRSLRDQDEEFVANQKEITKHLHALDTRMAVMEATAND